MAEKNIEMKQWNGSAWDFLYPTTLWSNIKNIAITAAQIPQHSASKLDDGTVTLAKLAQAVKDKFVPKNLYGTGNPPALENGQAYFQY